MAKGYWVNCVWIWYSAKDPDPVPFDFRKKNIQISFQRNSIRWGLVGRNNFLLQLYIFIYPTPSLPPLWGCCITKMLLTCSLQPSSTKSCARVTQAIAARRFSAVQASHFFGNGGICPWLCITTMHAVILLKSLEVAQKQISITAHKRSEK